MDKYIKFLSKRTNKLKASEIRELLKLTEGKNIISFAGGLPDPTVFDKDKLIEIARDVLENFSDKALQYSPTRGVSVFIETLKNFLLDKGINISNNDDIIVTTGSQEAIYLASTVLIDRRDAIIVEEPTYLAALNVFKYLESRLMPVPIDDDGMNTEVLEDYLRKLREDGRRVKLAYVNPTCQNPSGTTMSIARRKHLIELASQHDFLILEDDPYGYFIFEGERPIPLKSLDRDERVLYMSTFSKILAPGLRIGWAVGPAEIIRYMELAKQNVDLHSSTFSQYIVMEAIMRGVVDATIERARSLYKVKRDAMLEALEQNMHTTATWTKPIGGLFIMVTLKKKIDTKKLLLKAIEKGVAYVPGGSFYVSRRGSNTMRLNYSYPTLTQIREGINRLALTIKEST
ncbi:MAG: PLP-dependent aminotransferase family protein [Acidilobaceae archaeon]